MKRESFTLLEMILVLLLITITLFPLIEAFSIAVKTSKSITNTNIAIELAQQKLEQLQSVPYSSLSSTQESQGSISGYPIFSREAIVIEEQTNLKKVDVNVYWPFGTKMEQFGLSTYFTNY